MDIVITLQFDQKESANSLVDTLDRAASGQSMTIVDRMILRSLTDSVRAAVCKGHVRKPLPPLTRRQAEVFDYVRSYQASHEYAPKLDEIIAHFGLRSPATAKEHLDNLAVKGYIVRFAPRAERGYGVAP